MSGNVTVINQAGETITVPLSVKVRLKRLDFLEWDRGQRRYRVTADVRLISDLLRGYDPTHPIPTRAASGYSGSIAKHSGYRSIYEKTGIAD